MSASGAEDPLAGPVVAAVHHVVEHLKAVVAHADRVGVGKGEAELAAHRAVVLATAFHSPPMYWAGVCTRGSRRSTIWVFSDWFNIIHGPDYRRCDGRKTGLPHSGSARRYNTQSVLRASQRGNSIVFGSCRTFQSHLT